MTRVALIALLLAGCAYQPRITVSGGVRGLNGETEPVGCLAWEQRWSERASFEYEHCSDPTEGRPVNNRYDLSHDTATVQYSWGGRRK